MLHALDKW